MGPVGNPASSVTHDKSEREACAALAKEYAAELRDMGEPDEVALTIAAAIAARGQS
jgi:predicted RNase H-like nuclease (RuvC/YqgF family)